MQNRILFTERDYTPSELVSAANFLNQNYSGHSFEDIRQRLQEELREIRQDMISLMSAALDAGNQAVTEGNEQYVISGERNLLAVQDLSQDMSRMRQLFELFEHKTSLVQILDLSLRGEGVQIFIGGESGVGAPDEVQRRDRALRGRRRGGRHRRRHRPDAHGLRPRGADRRRHRQAALQRAVPAVTRRP